jgi:hypothetical protein
VREILTFMSAWIDKKVVLCKSFGLGKIDVALPDKVSSLFFWTSWNVVLFLKVR